MAPGDPIGKATRAVVNIPNRTSLYKSSELKPASGPGPFTPVQAINDRVGLLRGDITKLSVDAIVNAANTSLLGGGGVDGAIHRAAGPRLVQECRTLNGCPTGGAKITAGYNLPAKHVIHTVGPIYEDPVESERLLRSCYSETLKLAASKGVRTLAFSGISTGIYGYPSRDAAEVACDTVRRYLDTEGKAFEKVIFVTYESKDVRAYDEMLP